MTSYKPHLACFKCRKTFKRKLLKDINRDSIYDEEFEKSISKCPQCGGLMADMGLDFESPKKSDLKSWKQMEKLYSVGITFHSCGCSGPGYIPNDSDAIVDYFTTIKANYIEQKSFWARLKSKPTTQSEFSKDQNENWRRYTTIPQEFNLGTKNKPKYDTLRAQEYWNEKIIDIEKKIFKMKNANNA